MPPFLLPDSAEALSCDVEREPVFNPLETVGEETLETVLRAEPPLLAVLSIDKELILLVAEEAELEPDNAGLLTGFLATSALLTPEVLDPEPTSEAATGFPAAPAREEATELRRSSGSDFRIGSLADETPLLPPPTDSAPLFLPPAEIDIF